MGLLSKGVLLTPHHPGVLCAAHTADDVKEVLRVHTGAGLARAEDAALEAAHTDTRNGRTTIVLAQTSNDHLDELNARYQAIRHQHGELDIEAIPASGRPYTLHPGDQVQIRRTINHPDHGRLRNGTNALIRDIDPDAQTIELALIPDIPST